MINLSKKRIVDVAATPARWIAEVAVTKTMLGRTEACFALKPERLAQHSKMAARGAKCGRTTAGEFSGGSPN